MASTKSTASTTISSGDFVKIDGKGIALVKQQVCRDGAVMYIVQVCGCDFDVEIDAKRVQTVTADSDSETKQTTGSSSRFKIVTDQENMSNSMLRFHARALCEILTACRRTQNICCSSLRCQFLVRRVPTYQTRTFCQWKTTRKCGFQVYASNIVPNINRKMCSHFSVNSGRIYSDMEEDVDDKDSKFSSQIYRSNNLYKFKQNLVSDSELTMSPDEWKRFESDVLEENCELRKSWTALCMMLIYSVGNIELGESLLHYIRHYQNQSPNIPTLSTFIALCGQSGANQKQDLVLKEYHELERQVDVFDSITTKNLIIGFCGTDFWKKSLEFLEMTKFSQNPGPAYYNPIIIAALRQNDADTVFSLLNIMGEKGFTPSNAVFEMFVQVCSSPDREVNVNIKSLFEYFREYSWLPDRGLARHIEKMFVNSKTEKWTCNWTSVDESGTCQNCKHRLRRIHLTDGDFQNLQQEFLTKTLVGDNVYLKSNPKEVESFKEFIQEHAPFDVVVDALNVAALGKSNVLRKVVEFFARHHHKRVLVIGRQHMRKSLGRQLQPIMTMASTFFTDNISKDDPFTLYAAIYSGKSAMLVSNDYMRDHKCLLSSNLQGIFEQWQRCRQISMKKIHWDNFVFQMPLKYDTGPQKDLNGWHVPYEDYSQRAVYEHPNTYLCLRSKKPINKSKKIKK